MTDFVKEQVKPEDMIQVSDVAETVRVLLRMSPGCIVPEVQFLRPGDAALDELFVARAVAAAQPAEAEAPGLVGLAPAHERLVLGDRAAEVRVGALGEDRGDEVRLEGAAARARSPPAPAWRGRSGPTRGRRR